MDKERDVSVIVTTRNEAVNIGSCLVSIGNQAYPREKIEIVVVDNNSVDGTKEIARRYTDKVYDFGPERSAQRNFGVRQATGRYILYLDADMILSKEVISECVKTCESGDIIALYIPEEITGRGFWIKVRNFERGFYNQTVVDCVRFIRKDKFFDIGGFDETLTGPEDWDLDRRIRMAGKTGIIRSPIYHNEGRFNLFKYLRKKAYYSKSFARYIQKWGKNDIVIKKQLGFLYRFILVFCEDGKWRRLLSRPDLSAGMYFLRFLVGALGVKSIHLRQCMCRRKIGYGGCRSERTGG